MLRQHWLLVFVVSALVCVGTQSCVSGSDEATTAHCAPDLMRPQIVKPGQVVTNMTNAVWVFLPYDKLEEVML